MWKTLKAGVDPEFLDKETPQGGVVSPLLANIALGGIEECGGFTKRRSGHKYPSSGIRYADDIVFIVKSCQDAKTILI